MQFDSFADFINMGGYAFYVWLAYGVTATALAILIAHSLKKKSKVLKEIGQKIQREDRLRQNRSNKS
ncbi:heme exporter protein CcmD [Paraferrimonas sedimenticola]|uniref:Heme exporter protein D n=1 Tax=Paraferrimonas sedimenticola TaxID=375674 RepID=A0AA37RXV8_9GAMM|nr:heme exporter protein CcmD [Paraferrimonas sedimenticola]GLP97715.1 heme exporter protein D [Paraferrimonas sedimenticola]